MGLYSGGGGGGAYIWNEVSVSTCGGLIHGWAYIRGEGLIVGGLRSISKIYQNSERPIILSLIQLIDLVDLKNYKYNRTFHVFPFPLGLEFLSICSIFLWRRHNKIRHKNVHSN